jgi:hypothetical protein
LTPSKVYNFYYVSFSVDRWQFQDLDCFLSFQPFQLHFNCTVKSSHNSQFLNSAPHIKIHTHFKFTV